MIKPKTPDTGFRPLDGESISKHGDKVYYGNGKIVDYSFRPLDGESISKPV